MRAQLVRIGNSQGVRLPKVIIEQAGLGPNLEVAVEDGAVIIRASGKKRRGWAEDAKACRAKAEDHLGEWDTTIADGEWR